MPDMPFLLLPLSFAAGWASVPANGFTTSLYILAVLAVLYIWVKQDCKRRQAKFSWGWRAGLLILTALVLPLYFFVSRGWRGGFVLTAQAWGIFIASMLSYRAGSAL